MAATVRAVFQKSAATYEARGRLDPAGFAQHVDFQTRAAPEDLAPFVEHFWVINTTALKDCTVDPAGAARG
jgi:hypothetical protein